jgi:hypothetical protein
LQLVLLPSPPKPIMSYRTHESQNGRTIRMCTGPEILLLHAINVPESGEIDDGLECWVRHPVVSTLVMYGDIKIEVVWQSATKVGLRLSFPMRG